jgi:RNA polymerase sigma-70 factor (ECF subfamily)
MAAEIVMLRQLAEVQRLADTSPRTDTQIPRGDSGSRAKGAQPNRSSQTPRTRTLDPMSANDEATSRRFRDTVLPYLDDAYNLARYLTRNSDDANDIVQDAFLRAFRFFHTFKGDNPKPWLLTIVRNCFYSSLKAKSHHQTEPLSEDGSDDDSVAGDLWTREATDPEKILLEIHDAETIRALLNGLPIPFREALVLRAMEELSYQEIAAILDVPIGTVMSRLARARHLFKRAWLGHQEKERRS